MKTIEYLDKAVVEEKAGEARVDPNVGLMRLLDDAGHDSRHIRARAIVEGGAQLSFGTAKQKNSEDG